MGKRLGKLTESNTKCMIDVNNKKLINRSLDALVKNKINRIIIVVGYEGQKVIEHVGETYSNIPVIYIWNYEYAKTNNIYSLWLASDCLTDDDTILLESDLIFDDKIINDLIDDPYPNLAVVSKYESWMDGTVVTLDKSDNIVRFIPKKHFSYNEISQYYKTVNIYKFSKDFLCHSYVPFLKAYSIAMGNNEYYEQVLRVVLSLEKLELRGKRLNGEKWYEIDDVQDLHNAETVFAAESDRMQQFAERWGGYWRFPGIKDFCFLVNPYFPPSVMQEEIKAYFYELLSEYPSGQGVQRLLASKMFNCSPEHIIVGNGAAELINALMSGISGKVGVVVPTFHEYANRIGFENCAQLLPLITNNNFHYSVEDIKSFSKNVDVFILINPDNPTGHYLPRNDLLELALWFQRNSKRLIIDESFIDFSFENQAGSLLNETDLQCFPSLVIIKSISKSYGVPGIRLGVLATADKSVMSMVEKDISIWNINSFGEFFLQIIGKYEKNYQESTKKIRAERDRLFHALSAISYLRVIPSHANYFTCELVAKFNADEFCNVLLCNHNILIKNCANKPGFKGGEYVRIAVRNEDDNEYLIHALQQCEFSLTSKPVKKDVT